MPKAAAKTSTSKTDNTKVKVKAEAKVVAPPPVVASVPVSVEEPTPVDTENALSEQTSEFMVKMQTMALSLTALRTEFRVLERRWTRELKTAQKVNAKRKRKTGNRSPSGFVKPTLISTELATFLGKEMGSEMARTEVTREINKYIRANDLQDKENGRKINPDAKLAKLLKLKQSDELTYFNLQRYMSPHFAKAGAPPAANAV